MVFVDREYAFYSPLSRAWELLAGALLAFSRLENSGFMKWRKHWVGPTVGLAIAIGGTLVLQARYPFPGLLALVPVVSAILLICADPNSWVNRRVLASPWMVKIGILSYPLYLWHWPLLSFAFILESGRPSAGVRAMLVGLSFALAILTYKLVERPIRRISRSLAIGLLVATMVALGLLGKNVDDRDGLERIRYKRMITITESANEDFVDFEKRGLITERKCERPFKFPERDVCLMAHSERSPTAVVIGDSHALHAYWGLAKAFDKQGENLILLGRGACVPFANFRPDGDPNHCQPHMDEALSYIANNPTIIKAVLVYRGRYLPENSSATAVNVFSSGLERTLEILTKAGKEVFYFLPVVEPGFDPKLCLGNLPFGRKPPFSCEILLAEDDEKSELLRSTVLGVLAKYPAVQVVNPNNYLCSKGICSLNQKGHSLFKDENHLSHFGSMIIGGEIDVSK